MLYSKYKLKIGLFRSFLWITIALYSIHYSRLSMFLDLSSMGQQPGEACTVGMGREGRGLRWCLLRVLVVVLPGCWTAMLGGSSVRWPTVAHVQSPPLGVCGGTGGLSTGTTGRAAMHGEDPAHAAGAGAHRPH